jgi:hypothetical protein
MAGMETRAAGTPVRRPGENKLPCLVGTGGEIDFLSALVALMGFVELIGKDLFGGIAFGAFAGK